MADRPNHEFLDPLRRADEARIARSMKPAQRVRDEEAARVKRQEARHARSATPVVNQTRTREMPRARTERAPRPSTNRSARRGTPGWLVIVAVAAMAAGFAGALYDLGSGWQDEQAAPLVAPSNNKIAK